jgi:hypothetical protein
VPPYTIAEAMKGRYGGENLEDNIRSAEINAQSQRRKRCVEQVMRLGKNANCCTYI